MGGTEGLFDDAGLEIDDEGARVAGAAGIVDDDQPGRVCLTAMGLEGRHGPTEQVCPDQALRIYWNGAGRKGTQAERGKAGDKAGSGAFHIIRP